MTLAFLVVKKIFCDYFDHMELGRHCQEKLKDFEIGKKLHSSVSLVFDTFRCL